MAPRSSSEKAAGRPRFGLGASAIMLLVAMPVVALLAPWSAEPFEIPPPRIDAAELERSRRHDEAEARAAQRDGLDADVRELGSGYRDYGRAESEGDDHAASLARQRITAATQPALRVGIDAIRRLRAYQLQSFLREVRRWEATGEESDELCELGGGFVATLRRHGWVDEKEGRRRVLLHGPALRALFKLRWNEAAGLSRTGPGGVASVPAGLEVSLDERRALLRFSIEHPIAAPGSAPGPRPRGLDFKPAFEDQYALRKIDELAALDPSYPGDLARGVVLYRLRRYALAHKAFSAHLDRFPDGPYALRARNYLRAALEGARDDG